MERTPERLERLAVRLDRRAYNWGASGGNERRTARRLARRIRKQLLDRGRVLPIYVYARGIDRGYGGPEEGGWWYDAAYVLEVRRAWSWKQALKHVRELREEHPTCPRGRGSVIGGTDVYIKACASEDMIPDDDTARPRYE